MTTMRVDWLRGCGTALVTPFTATGAIDEAGMRALVERQIAGGVRLLVPCGTTGESATLSDEEQQRLIAVTVEVARGRARVLAGTGGNATAGTVERAKAAQRVGADGVLVVTPYYNKPSQEGLAAHYRAVAEAVPDLPVVVYNVPGRTGSNIEPATVLALARDTPGVVAVKEASGNVLQVMEILRERPTGFRVLSGDDQLTLPLLALGAEGVISVVANEVPALMSRLCELALAGDWTGARELHYHLLPLMTANFDEPNPGPVKAVMALQGLLEDRYRLPLVPVRRDTRRRLEEILRELDGLA
jgi:4-hydroxy-tetrahydrodipicolinate synthase